MIKIKAIDSIGNMQKNIFNNPYSPVNVKQMKKIEQYVKWSGAELSPNHRRVSN